MTDKFEIQIWYEGHGGKLDTDRHSYPPSAFGGSCPEKGDHILNPLGPPNAREKIDFNDPANREWWVVTERFFVPDDESPRCVLVTKTIPASTRETRLL
jgi:hypothetical protein